MVWHLFDRIFGNSGDPKNYLKNQVFNDKRISQLQEEGFSEDEAKRLAWMYSQRSNGRIYGLIGGASLVYFGGPVFKRLEEHFPRLKYQKSAGLAMRGAIIILSAGFGEYLSITERKRAQSTQGGDDLYSNNIYYASKNALCHNFEPFNRKFSEAEKDIFNEKSVFAESNLKRKWIYNPHIHGEDEQQWKEKIQFFFLQNNAPWENKKIQAEIKEQNQGRLASGEQLQMSPYFLNRDVDPTGAKHGLQGNKTLDGYARI